MDKERFNKITSNKNFIPGIHNYCDRWCEKRAFTSRCGNYAVSQEIFDDIESFNDIEKLEDNDKLLDALGDIFRITLELLEEVAEKFDIDMAEIDRQLIEDEEFFKEQNQICIELARKYANDVSAWFDEHDEDLQAKEQEYNRLLELGVNQEEIKQQADELNSFIEVIQWYQHFIDVKLHRALPDKNIQLGMSFDGMEDDMNGSAKVALIAMDRSIGAWGKLLQHFPDSEDSILDILVLLNKIRKLTEEKFPDARSFIRPGLDE